ncbi:MAG: GNAT family N-acetyltransferase [Actinoplanes sp.]
MFIRPAAADDAAAIAAVQVRSWRAAYRGLLPREELDALDIGRGAQTWTRILAASQWPRSGTLVAEGEDGVVGFAALSPTRDDDADPALVGELAALYSLEQVWGTGVGRSLMTAAQAALTEAGYTRSGLWVLENNTRARRFYEAAGWAPDGAVRQDGVTEVRYAWPASRA